MFTLRLFHQSEPFRQIAEKALDEEPVTIGRDQACDWAVPDESRTLSRRHLVISTENGVAMARDVSANGVWRGPERERLPADRAVALSPGEALRLGEFMILVEEAEARPKKRTALQAVEERRKPPADASLLEAFCAGAKLDASAFSEEEPAEVMRRVGEVYRQMVQGLGEVMRERTMAKTEHQLERTTISGDGNNPFRWAPPDRVAVDILRPRDDGFLAGPAAVRRSFSDVNAHLACTLAGARAAAAAALEALDPNILMDDAKARAGILKSRQAEAWAQFVETYAAVTGEGFDDPESEIAKAFRRAYEEQQKALQLSRTVS